jgi:hypothetical protein
MNQDQKIKALQHIRPDAEYVMRELDLEWLDTKQAEPTEDEIEAGWVAYQAAQQAEAEAKATQKAALLNRLGLTQEEFNTLTA